MQVLSRSFARLAVVAALFAAPLVQAQSAAPIDAEKQKLIDRILTLFHPENDAIFRAQNPAEDTLQKSRIVLMQNHIPQDRIDKALTDIKADAEKYVDTVTPIVSASAKKAVGPAVGPLLAKNFSVEELKQIVTLFESPVKGKFEKLVPEMELAVLAKVRAEVGPEIDKDMTALQKSAGAKLQAAAIR